MQTCDRELLRQLDSRYGPNDARRRGMSQPAACNSRPKMRRGGQIQRHLELWLRAAGLVAAAAWMSWHREPSKQAVFVIARGGTRTKSQCLTTAPRHAGGTQWIAIYYDHQALLVRSRHLAQLFFPLPSHFSQLFCCLLIGLLCFQIYDTGNHGITNSHSEATWRAIARQHL